MEKQKNVFLTRYYCVTSIIIKTIFILVEKREKTWKNWKINSRFDSLPLNAQFLRSSMGVDALSKMFEQISHAFMKCSETICELKMKRVCQNARVNPSPASQPLKKWNLTLL